MYASPKQISYILSLAGKRGFSSVEIAAQEYGFAPGHSLTSCDASQLIDWLKKETSPSYAAAAALGEKRHNAMERFLEALHSATEEDRAAIRAAGPSSFEN